MPITADGGGGKSHNIAIAILERCEQQPGYHAVIIRDYKTTLKDGAIALLARIAADYPQRYHCHKARHTARIDFDNGSTISVLGSERNKDNLRGLEAANLAWLEEAQGVSQEPFDLLGPTMRRADAKIVVSFNPTSPDDPAYTMFVAPDAPPPDTYRCQVIYGDYIRTAELDRQQARDRITRPAEWAHIWLGELKTAAGAFFKPEMIDDDEFWHDPQRIIRAWDLAASASPNADFTVGVKLARDTAADGRPCWQIQDVVRGRWTTETRNRIIAQTARADGDGVPVAIERQPGANEKMAQRLYQELLAPARVLFPNPQGSKATPRRTPRRRPQRRPYLRTRRRAADLVSPR